MGFVSVFVRWPIWLIRALVAVAVLLFLGVVYWQAFFFSPYIPRLQSFLWSDSALAGRFLGDPVLASSTANTKPVQPTVLWSVAGVFVSVHPLALLSTQGQTHVVRVGDLLFDGGRVQQIRSDAVVLSYPTGQRLLPVFSPQAGT